MRLLLDTLSTLASVGEDLWTILPQLLETQTYSELLEEVTKVWEKGKKYLEYIISNNY